jgi:hypothetical protein
VPSSEKGRVGLNNPGRPNADDDIPEQAFDHGDLFSLFTLLPEIYDSDLDE